MSKIGKVFKQLYAHRDDDYKIRNIIATSEFVATLQALVNLSFTKTLINIPTMRMALADGVYYLNWDDGLSYYQAGRPMQSLAIKEEFLELDGEQLYSAFKRFMIEEQIRIYEEAILEIEQTITHLKASL